MVPARSNVKSNAAAAEQTVSARTDSEFATLLASVSRTFYLTIRILPREVRAPVGLAYLLARASDTIADSSDSPVEIRLRHLARFAESVAGGERSHLAETAATLSSPHRGERALLASLVGCIDRLEALPPFDRNAIQAVLARIIRGQTLDLERFAQPGTVTALPDAAALEEYTYLVAGCVGEFWTRLCAHHLPRYSRLSMETLEPLARDFGKGLQLVNILRDLPADLRSGRCYLPANELAAAGADPAALDPRAARPVFFRWHSRAADLLEAGRRYIIAVRPARIRAGCFIPWHLAIKTLQLLETQPPLESEPRLKVSRAAVRRSVLLAMLAAFTNHPLRPRGSAKA